MPSEPTSLEEVSHLALKVGRILFQNNADTAEVEDSLVRFASAFGCEAHVLVTYKTLLLTLISNQQFRTKAGNRVPAMNVNMATVADVNSLVAKVEGGLMGLMEVRTKLEEIERQPAIYGRWTVVAGLSLTAASLSRLFGGDWPTFFVVLAAGAVGTWLRQEMGRRGTNLFLIAFVAAFLSGVVAGAAVLLRLSDMPALCLVAPGMIIVPGVPLINSIQDMIKNHMDTGIARLGLGVLITLAIAFGLFAATAVTGAQIPVEEPSQLPSLAEDALFSALAALGYLFLFNVPVPLAWVGVLCGVASHTTRTFCLQHGIDIVVGSLIGALAAGFLAHGFARHFLAPASAFVFPGVVAMIPGAFAFRSVIGCLQIIGAGSTASPSLVAETLALSATSVLMVLVIAIGVAAPLILMKDRKLK
jgi:uncharacterized membrane protein YjjP (DUF1212 family)